MLVIIGLLIGGILTAQSMINAAKIQSQIQQIQQFDIAARQFKERLRELPGDSNLFSPAGNNNGVVDGADYWGGAAVFPWAQVTEAGNFWKHMSDSGVLPKTWPSVDGSIGVRPGIDIPKAVVGLPGTVVVGTSIRPNGYYSDLVGDFWVLCYRDISQGNARFCTDASIKATDALAIDLKMDDGNPSAGFVLAGSIPGGGPSNLCVSSGSYLTSGTLPKCGLHIKMFGVVGEAQ